MYENIYEINRLIEIYGTIITTIFRGVKETKKIVTPRG